MCFIQTHTLTNKVIHTNTTCSYVICWPEIQYLLTTTYSLVKGSNSGLSSHPTVYGLQYVVKNPFIGGVILHL